VEIGDSLKRVANRLVIGLGKALKEPFAEKLVELDLYSERSRIGNHRYSVQGFVYIVNS